MIKKDNKNLLPTLKSETVRKLYKFVTERLTEIEKSHLLTKNPNMFETHKDITKNGLESKLEVIIRNLPEKEYKYGDHLKF